MSVATTPRERPLWFVVLKDFGLPTLFALLLLGSLLSRDRADAQERRELLVGIKRAIEQQTVALVQLTGETRATADVVRLHWPSVRIARAESPSLAVPASAQADRPPQ